MARLDYTDGTYNPRLTRDRTLRTLLHGLPLARPRALDPLAVRILAGEAVPDAEVDAHVRGLRRAAAGAVARCIRDNGDHCPASHCPHTTEAVHLLLDYAESGPVGAALEAL